MEETMQHLQYHLKLREAEDEKLDYLYANNVCVCSFSMNNNPVLLFDLS